MCVWTHQNSVQDYLEQLVLRVSGLAGIVVTDKDGVTLVRGPTHRLTRACMQARGEGRTSSSPTTARDG